MSEPEGQVTAEHVRLAAEAVKRSYAQPYIARAERRMRAVFMASMLWAVFVGICIGRTLHSFPWGSLGVALAYTVIAVVVFRRNR